MRVCAFQHKAAAVQIVFHMRNDEIPFRYQNAVSRHQLQIFNKGKIVQARSGHLTAIDFHRRKDCDRGNLAGASGRPFNHLKLCFKQIILKFERQSVLIVVACTPELLQKATSLQVTTMPSIGISLSLAYCCSCLIPSSASACVSVRLSPDTCRG